MRMMQIASVLMLAAMCLIGVLPVVLGNIMMMRISSSSTCKTPRGFTIHASLPLGYCVPSDVLLYVQVLTTSVSEGPTISEITLHLFGLSSRQREGGKCSKAGIVPTVAAHRMPLFSIVDNDYRIRQELSFITSFCDILLNKICRRTVTLFSNSSGFPIMTLLYSYCNKS